MAGDSLKRWVVVTASSGMWFGMLADKPLARGTLELIAARSVILAPRSSSGGEELAMNGPGNSTLGPPVSQVAVHSVEAIHWCSFESQMAWLEGYADAIKEESERCLYNFMEALREMRGA